MYQLVGNSWSWFIGDMQMTGDNVIWSIKAHSDFFLQLFKKSTLIFVGKGKLNVLGKTTRLKDCRLDFLRTCHGLGLNSSMSSNIAYNLSYILKIVLLIPDHNLVKKNHGHGGQIRWCLVLCHLMSFLKEQF